MASNNPTIAQMRSQLLQQKSAGNDIAQAGENHVTKQEGPFFRVTPKLPNQGEVSTRGVREATEPQHQGAVAGAAGTTSRRVPKSFSNEEIASLIKDPGNPALQIAKQHTQEAHGKDFSTADISPSSLQKQSAIATTHMAAVNGSPEYKQAIFDAYAQQMPEVVSAVGAKNYEDLLEKSYRQLAKETGDQFNKIPVSMSFHRNGEGNYNGAKEMAGDVLGNRHLYVFQGGDKHDFLHHIDKHTGLNENEKFRAVHDFFGHAIHGNEFGPAGEEKAWNIHRQMYSPLAQLAMTAETRGQNSVVNYSPLNAELKSEVAKLRELQIEAKRRKDTQGYAMATKAIKDAFNGFQYAPQKAILLPPEFTKPEYEGGMPDYVQKLIKPKAGTKISSALTHFSNKPDLKFTDPSRYGTGIKGAEAERLNEYPGAVRDRSYFYMGEPGEVAPEPGLGVHRYRGESSSLYDITQDPMKFRMLAREANRVPYTAKYNQGMTYPLQEANDMERLVREHGYQGMANPKASKPMAIMFNQTPVQRQAKGGNVTSQDAMKLALTQHGMYSPLEKAAMGVNRTKGTPAEFMAEIAKQPGFRKEEVSDRNLQLPDQKLTKAEMLQHLQKSPMPRVSEHVLHDFGDEEEALDTAAQHLFGQSYDEIYDDRKAREKVNNWIEANSSKYSTYQMPGGKNYREVLLQTPHFAEHDEHRIMELEADKRRSPQPSHWGMATGEAKELADLMKRKASMGEQYHSSHFEGHPNILANIRMSDRTGPNNEKLLHLEEIQSDWHQAGRKHGYANNKSNTKEDEMYRTLGGTQKTPVPDAPFKKNWHELAVKHALHHAAKHGYHGVVITPGQEQAKRYDLSKHVNDLQYDPQTKTLSAWDHSGNKVVDKSGVEEDQLSDYIGKEGARKLLAKNPEDTQVKQLFGADLQVGGEGMKGFYDKMIPEYLNKLGKPHNVKVGKMNMPRPPLDSSLTYGYPGAEDYVGGRSTWSEFLAKNPKAAQEFSTPVHHFPITEPMRQQILQGQPMYKQGGIIHKAEGGIVQPNIAQMRMALQQRNPIEVQNIGVNEAPNMLPKIYFSPSQNENDDPTVGNSFNQDGMPIGGVDQDQQQPGQQLMAPPQQQPGQPPQGAQPPQGGLLPQGGPQGGPQGPTPPMGNMLSMTPQGQTMQALAPQGPPGPPGIQSGPPGAPTQPAPTGMKSGGPAHFDKGGLSSSDEEMDAALAHANSIPKSKKPTVAEMKEAIFQKAQQGLMKPSEALGKHEGAYLHMTEADRSKVEKRKHGMRGGVGFSQIGLEDPEYAGRTWGVGKSSVQSKLLNRQKRGLSPEDKSIWTTFIGTPEMHTSNQLVFNRMWNKFQEARKSGLLSPEQEAKMLDILRSAMTKATPKKPAQAIFEPDANFDNSHHLFDTFERHRVLSDLMAGNRIGGKKGQIFNASKMIEDTTDPRLLHAPSLSVGPHTFSFSGETSHEPHLNKAFPYMLHGEAHPDTFQQIPFTEAAPDFTNKIRQTKGREPGYMDIVRGIPRQHITEEYLTGLQKQGRKKGGNVKLAPTQDTMRLALTKKKAK